MENHLEDLSTPPKFPDSDHWEEEEEEEHDELGR
jgi:hypothetical protein